MAARPCDFVLKSEGERYSQSLAPRIRRRVRAPQPRPPEGVVRGHCQPHQARAERVHGRFHVNSRPLLSPAMSRLPQPSSSYSSSNARLRLQSTPTVPSSLLRAPVTPLAKPRTKTPTATASPTVTAKPRVRTPTAAPSPSTTATPRVRTPTTAPTPTLRSQRSQPNLKTPNSRSLTKSPAKRTSALPSEEDVVPPLPKPQLSIREQIALRRAEVKKVMKSPVRDEFAELADASPHTYNQPVERDVDFGRWSIKESIERARSSGMCLFVGADVSSSMIRWPGSLPVCVHCLRSLVRWYFLVSYPYHAGGVHLSRCWGAERSLVTDLVPGVGNEIRSFGPHHSSRAS